MTPFKDDTASATIAGITIENGTDRIAVYGSADIARDRKGLAAARELALVFRKVAEALEAEADLPEVASPRADATVAVANPFQQK